MSGMISGIKYLQIAKRNSSGYAVGTAADPETLSTATVYGAYVHKYPVSAGLAAPEYQTVSASGGGKEFARATSGTGQTPNTPLTLSLYDSTIEGLAKNYTPDSTTISGDIGTVPNSEQESFTSFIIGMSYQFLKQNSVRWMNVFKLNVQMQGGTAGEIGDGSGGGNNLANLAYQLIHGKSTRNAFGQLWSAANARPKNDVDVEHRIESDYPLGMALYVKNGVATTFTLPYLPVISTVGKFYSFNNGVAEALSSANTANGLITMTGAGTSAHLLELLYPTNFVASS